MSDACDERDDEVNEPAGVEEWIADESEAGALGIGLDDTPLEG